MNLDDAGIAGIAFSGNPASLLESSDNPTDGAFFESQTRRQAVLRKPGLPTDFQQRVGFGDRNWLTARSSIWLM